MEQQKKIQLLEGVLAAVLDRALVADKLPPAAVRLALTDALHTVRELERQMAEKQAAAEKEAKDHGKPDEA